MRSKIILSITSLLFFLQTALATTYYVSTTGDDTYGDGSSGNPWRTLKHAANKVLANQGHTIQLAAGTFIEGGRIEIPPEVNVQGVGKHFTIIKAASSFYYNPSTPGYATNKYLISLQSASPVNGNQGLKNFTIDGDSKQLHGGIYVRYRNNVLIDGVKVQNTNFNGIWLWDVKDSRITNTDLVDCSWGSPGYSAGALHLGNLERVTIDQMNLTESVGYGIKAIGPTGENNIFHLKIHGSRISVNPYGVWENGKAPNIAIELWSVNLAGCEVYNSYIDNTISLVANNSNSASGIQTIRLHHNTIDMETRAKGAGYGVELTMHDAEIDHNYFFKGSYGIANWAQHAMKNWNIHHNVFYALEGVYPGDILRSERSGLHNVNFYNNTVEFTGDKTMNVIGLYGGTSENVNVVNNLFINNNTAYSYYANSLIHMENGSVVNNLAIKNNFLDSLSAGSVSGTYSNNLEGDPKIYKKDQRPTPYYQPTPGSPLSGAGLTDSAGFNGMTADIGAFEYDESLFNEAPHVTIDNPSNNSVFYTGSAITVTANVSDSTGTITDVQFYNGTIKLGEAVVSPYTFTINDLPEGNHSLTAIAKDNFDAVDTSAAVNIRVVSWIKLGLYAPDAALSGYMTLVNDSTASKGSYFLIPAGHGTNYTIGASAAQFNFELSKSDNYTVWVRVIAPGPDNQGYYLYDGKGHWTTWMAGVFDEWTWVRVTDAYTNEVATFPFTTGMNILVFSWLHEDVHVDQVLITNNPEFVPSVKGENGAARTNRSVTTEFVQPKVPEISKGALIYPNPVRDDFTLTYHSPVAQQAEIKIITMTSVIAKQTTVPITQGVNAIKIRTDNLRNGMYVVAFVTSTGDHFATKISVSK